jgi:hypothetical protein
VPDRFATGASAIRPTPDTHLSRFHWDRLANLGGNRKLLQSPSTGIDPFRTLGRRGLFYVNQSRSSRKTCNENDAFWGSTTLFTMPVFVTPSAVRQDAISLSCP